MSHAVKKSLDKEQAEPFLNAEVVEVYAWGDSHAAVIGRMKSHMDLRWLLRVDGRWLNMGNDGAATLDRARQLIKQSPPD
jgi:hypothetical protein